MSLYDKIWDKMIGRGNGFYTRIMVGLGFLQTTLVDEIFNAILTSVLAEEW